MQNTLGLSAAIALIYTLLCFFDMRFIKKEDGSVPFRVQFKSTVFVFVSSLLGIYLLNSMSGGDGDGNGGGGSITAFTGAPGF